MQLIIIIIVRHTVTGKWTISEITTAEAGPNGLQYTPRACHTAVVVENGHTISVSGGEDAKGVKLDDTWLIDPGTHTEC